MNTHEIYSHHLYKVKVAEFLNNRNYETIFFSENCFAIKRREDNRFLTAFKDGKIDFFGEKCSSWEKFYILDEEAIIFINNSIKSGYRNKYNEKITNFTLSIKNLKLLVHLGQQVFAPSFIPRAELLVNKNSLEYKTVTDLIKTSKRKPLIYFCIYGKDEYYDCFFLALESLIQRGGYTGDILIKTDDIGKSREFCNKFNNTFHYSKIENSLGIFNRYYLHESFLQDYDSIIYFDSDILTINSIEKYLERFFSEDFIAYQEGDMPLLLNHIEKNSDRKDFALKFKWFGINNLFPTDFIHKYYLFNSGFYAINNLSKVKPIFDRIISYKPFEGYCGDQPFMNLALYNSNLTIKTLFRGDGLQFSRSNEQTFKNLDKVLIHFNSGVGNVSKLELMKNAWNYINENNL